MTQSVASSALGRRSSRSRRKESAPILVQRGAERGDITSLYNIYGGEKSFFAISPSG